MQAAKGARHGYLDRSRNVSLRFDARFKEKPI